MPNSIEKLMAEMREEVVEASQDFDYASDRAARALANLNNNLIEEATIVGQENAYLRAQVSKAQEKVSHIMDQLHELMSTLRHMQAPIEQLQEEWNAQQWGMEPPTKSVSLVDVVVVPDEDVKKNIVVDDGNTDLVDLVSNDDTIDLVTEDDDLPDPQD